MALAKHTTILLVGAGIAAWVGAVAAQEANPAAEPLPVPERIQVQDQTSLWSMKRELQAHKAAVAASTLDELNTLAQIEQARRGERPPASAVQTVASQSQPRSPTRPTAPRAVLSDYHLHWIGMSRTTGLMTAVLSKAGHYTDVVAGDEFDGLAVNTVTADTVTVSLHGQRTELRL